MLILLVSVRKQFLVERIEGKYRNPFLLREETLLALGMFLRNAEVVVILPQLLFLFQEDRIVLFVSHPKLEHGITFSGGGIYTLRLGQYSV